MKTHFIFNYSVISYPDILPLIEILLQNKFPVTIISDRVNTYQIKQKISMEKLNLVGTDQANNLQDLFLIACPSIPELRYLTVVFEHDNKSAAVAEELGLYVIDIKNKNLVEIFKKLKVVEPYQLQYLPEIKKIKNFLKYKMGYPTSIYQYLHGEYSENGISLYKNSKKLAGDSLLDLGNFNYFINNPGDPFFLSKNYLGHTCVFEQEIINILGRYYGLTDLTARGFVTSGGTEGNFSALWWARSNLIYKMKKKFPQRKVRIAIFFSSASHYSIIKIAGQLNLEPHIIPAQITEEINIEIFSAAIKKHMRKSAQIPIIVSANAGTIKTGAIDNVPKMKKILDNEVRKNGGNYFIHLDAACTGAVLPLLQPFGKNIKNYFTQLGISTIAISAHKFFGCTNICGIILTTKKFLNASNHRNGFKISYIGHIHDITPSGSRSGNNVLQIHNIFYTLDLHTDQSRLKKILNQSQKNCEYLYQELLKLYDPHTILWLKNSFSIIFPKPADSLVKKYSLMPISDHKVGIYGLLNLDKKLTDLFIADLKKDPEPYYSK